MLTNERMDTLVQVLKNESVNSNALGSLAHEDLVLAIAQAREAIALRDQVAVLAEASSALAEELECIESPHGDCRFCNPDEAFGPPDDTGHTPECLYQAVKWVRAALSTDAKAAAAQLAALRARVDELEARGNVDVAALVRKHWGGIYPSPIACLEDIADVLARDDHQCWTISAFVRDLADALQVQERPAAMKGEAK